MLQPPAPAPAYTNSKMANISLCPFTGEPKGNAKRPLLVSDLPECRGTPRGSSGSPASEMTKDVAPAAPDNPSAGTTLSRR